MSANREIAAKNLLIHSGCLKKNEAILIVSDEKTQDIGSFLNDFCKKEGLKSTHKTIHALGMHGAEPPQEIAEAMLEYPLIAGLTSYSMAHTQARKKATDKGARYLSLPDYDWTVIDAKALTVNFEEQRPIANKLAQKLDGAKNIHITTSNGTDLKFNIEGRPVNNCHAILDEPGSLGSPPDIEVNIAPVEHHTKGIFVVDGSIPHPDLGILSCPVKLTIQDGAVTNIESDNPEYVTKLNKLFDQHGHKSRIVGELGFGLNPLASLSGKMLEDEGVKGSFHCGIGSNATIGGKNVVSFHLDFIGMRPNLIIDDEMIMEQGNIII